MPLMLVHCVCRWRGQPKPKLPMRIRFLWLTLFLSFVLLYGGACYGLQQMETQASAIVLQGINAYEEGSHDDAAQIWSRAIDGYPYTSAWGAATFNVGQYMRERHRYHEAILRFKSLLGSSLDDRDPSGYLMEAYQNYHHAACLQISASYEDLGNYRTALRYGVLARDRYPYQSWCGTCLSEAAESLDKQIKRLEERCANEN
jgi:tetratricopeptide (TPR) repeat protein